MDSSMMLALETVDNVEVLKSVQEMCWACDSMAIIRLARTWRVAAVNVAE